MLRSGLHDGPPNRQMRSLEKHHKQQLRNYTDRQAAGQHTEIYFIIIFHTVRNIARLFYKKC